MKIQTMLAEGYAPTQIKEMLHTTYFRIRRYAKGDPFNLCRFQGDRVSEANQYRDDIVKLLMQNVSLKHMLEQISALGYQGKRRAFEDYCHKLIAELGIPYIPKRNTNMIFSQFSLHSFSSERSVGYRISDGAQVASKISFPLFGVSTTILKCRFMAIKFCRFVAVRECL